MLLRRALTPSIVRADWYGAVSMGAAFEFIKGRDYGKHTDVITEKEFVNGVSRLDLTDLLQVRTTRSPLMLISVSPMLKAVRDDPMDYVGGVRRLKRRRRNWSGFSAFRTFPIRRRKRF